MKVLAPVVQKLDSAIHQINLYPVDKYQGSQLHHPLDRDLSSGWCYTPFEQLEPEIHFWWFQVQASCYFHFVIIIIIIIFIYLFLYKLRSTCKEIEERLKKKFDVGVWTLNRGTQRQFSGKYLFGRRFENQNFRNICCEISCLPASPRIFEHLQNGIITHFKRIFTLKKATQNFREPFFWLKREVLIPIIFGSLDSHLGNPNR